MYLMRHRKVARWCDRCRRPAVALSGSRLRAWATAGRPYSCGSNGEPLLSPRLIEGAFAPFQEVSNARIERVDTDSHR